MKFLVIICSFMIIILITPIISEEFPLLNVDYRRKDTTEFVEHRTRGDFRPEYDLPPLTSTVDLKHGDAGAAAARFTTKATTTKKRKRTTPPRISMVEDCDYLAYYCLKAYDTGKVCGRTIYYTYSTFKNYCLLDYVNCMERYEVWQIVHMGECFDVTPLTDYVQSRNISNAREVTDALPTFGNSPPISKDYPYQDDYFLDNYYIIENM